LSFAQLGQLVAQLSLASASEAHGSAVGALVGDVVGFMVGLGVGDAVGELVCTHTPEVTFWMKPGRQNLQLDTGS